MDCVSRKIVFPAPMFHNQNFYTDELAKFFESNVCDRMFFSGTCRRMEFQLVSILNKYPVSAFVDKNSSLVCYLFEYKDHERFTGSGIDHEYEVLALLTKPTDPDIVVDAKHFRMRHDTSPTASGPVLRLIQDVERLSIDEIHDRIVPWDLNASYNLSKLDEEDGHEVESTITRNHFCVKFVEQFWALNNPTDYADQARWLDVQNATKELAKASENFSMVNLEKQSTPEQEQNTEEEQSDGPVVKRALKAYIDASDILTPKEQCERFIKMYGTVSARKPKIKQTVDLIVPKAVDNRTFLDGLITFLEDTVLDRLFRSPVYRNFHVDVWSLEGEHSHPITVLKDPNRNHYCFVFDNPDHPAAAGLRYLTVLSVETTDDFSVKAAGFFRIRFDADPNCEEKQRYLVAKERCDLVEPYEPNMFSSSLPTFVSQFIRHHWMLANPSFVEDECKRLGIDKGDADNLMSVFTRRNLDDQMYVLGPVDTRWKQATDADLKKYSRLYDAVQDWEKEPQEVKEETMKEVMEETMEAPDPQEHIGPQEKSSVQAPDFSMLQLTNLIEVRDPTDETYKLHVCDRQGHTVEKDKETFEFTITLEIEGQHVIAALVWIDIMHIGAPYIYVKMFAGKSSDLLVTEGNCANGKYISGRDYTKIRNFIFDGIAKVVKEARGCHD